MLAYAIKRSKISNRVFIPKYYDPELYNQISQLHNTHDLFTLGELIESGIITVQTGHEIGKMAYGTGNIPFVRTSDITNWEIKTIPKQGVSEEIYSQYAKREDVQANDILFVRDGTYLIGTNCLVTEMDLPMLYQSHILKIRVVDDRRINPYLLFLSLNCTLVQRQIRNMQFTADIIDTLGSRYKEIILPFPKDENKKNELIVRITDAFRTRIKYKAAIKQMPILIERVLDTNSSTVFSDFFARSVDDILHQLVQDTTSLEFGEFSAYTLPSDKITNRIYLPKYYDPEIQSVLGQLSNNCMLMSIQDLVNAGSIELATGDEIGKMAYGTGRIPFVRTSDFSNWEIKADTKQGVSEEIYNGYSVQEDVKAGDILLVRDGTYLVGSSCMITECDTKMLYCGGLYKIRSKNKELLNEYLLLGLLNSYIVKRQLRTKQFTRDVIDTLGRRINEVILPIPKDLQIKSAISQSVKAIIDNRIEARRTVSLLAESICS